jgi:hypothetical protein
VLQERAAAGRVDGDRVELLERLEGRQVAARQLPRVRGNAGVRVKRATAALDRRNENLEPVPREHADRVGVDVRMRVALDAALQKRHPGPS